MARRFAADGHALAPHGIRVLAVCPGFTHTNAPRRLAARMARSRTPKN